MNFDIPASTTVSAGRRAALLLVSMLFVATNARAANQDITVMAGTCPAQGQTPNNTEITYGAHDGVAVNETIGAQSTGGAAIEWFKPTGAETFPCMFLSQTSAKCFGMTITIPTGSAAGTSATVTGTPVAPANSTPTDFARLILQVSTPDGKCGNRSYAFHIVPKAAVGGWGDPHMTTVEGVPYDFQSAGEFTALSGDGLVIQTRQRPVSTSSVGPVNAYTGLGTCVSLYSAVAARIGSNRVTLQPNLSGQPDPSGLQLRVNGQLVTLTQRGIDLRAGGSADASAKLEGRIVQPFGGGYEFDDAFGMQLVATPAYWPAQQTWYLNLNVYQTSARRGIWGRLAEGSNIATVSLRSWLPALPDGTSLGSRPQALDQRYQDLYGKFADAWRVIEASAAPPGDPRASLFDYAPGTNTATFTLPGLGEEAKAWPRFNPQSCLIQGQPTAEPATPAVAAQACNGITNPAQKADCIFDVTVTGNIGFAQTYATMQQFQPHGPGWQPVLAGVGGGDGQGWPWWWWILILILGLILVALYLRKKTV